MSNMSYCRFHNTVEDLEDCLEYILDDLSESEEKKRKRLVEICYEIIDIWEYHKDEDD